MKRKFIINPHAGKERVKKGLPRLEKRFKKENGGFDCVLTQNRVETTNETRTALKAGYDQIVAVGGDGTLNAVVNGFFENGKSVNPDALLTVSDWGTGCDYFRTVSGKERIDWIDLVLDHEVRSVDIGKITFLDGGLPETYFTNIGSVGMSASVVLKQREVASWVPALLAYSLPAIMTLFTFRSPSLQVTIDGEVIDGPCLNLFFAKGKTAGGGMKLGGGVALDDGKFDITWIKGMPLSQSLPRFPKIYTGRFSGDDNFRKITGKRLDICSKEKLPVEFDGEVMGHTDISVSLLCRAIRLCFPSEMT